MNSLASVKQVSEGAGRHRRDCVSYQDRRLWLVQDGRPDLVLNQADVRRLRLAGIIQLPLEVGEVKLFVAPVI